MWRTTASSEIRHSHDLRLREGNPMHKIVLSTAGVLAFVLAILLAPVRSEAMTVGTPAAIGAAVDSTSFVTKAYCYRCGWGWRRGWGWRGRGPVVVLPRACPFGFHLGPYGRRCWRN
jgi:hypothetical protein